jgi:hypothetical protein
MKLEISRQVFEKDSSIKFHELLPVGVELFHADGQTDVTKLIVGFCNFANSPKNGCFSYRIHLKNKIFDLISGVWGVKRSEIVGQKFRTVIGVYPPPPQVQKGLEIV